MEIMGVIALHHQPQSPAQGFRMAFLFPGLLAAHLEPLWGGVGVLYPVMQSAGIPPFHVCQAIDPNQSEAVPKPSPTGKQHEKRRGKIQPSLTGFNNFQPDLDS